MTKIIKQIIMVKPPEGCWQKGYSVTKGKTKNSLNKTTLYSHEHHIVANQKRLKNNFNKLQNTIQSLGIKIKTLPFPKEIDSPDCTYHDGVFIRDSGFMFKNYWIKANFSAENRQIEAETYAKIIKNKFKKDIISLPKGAYMEFGEVFYLRTKHGSYYFGGLSRANKKGHDFLKNILKPDNYCLIKSKGYHVDTVMTPVLNKANELVAILVAKDMLDKKSYSNIKKLKVEIIDVKNEDSSDEDGLGNYAVNALVWPGALVSGAKFTTPGVAKRLKQLGVKFYTVPLKDFNYSGGSAHCLTNEIYK